MKKFIFTFGSSQLSTISHILNPLMVMIVIESESEAEARSEIFSSFIGPYFGTCYPYEPYAQEFKEKYNMREYYLDDIIKMEESVSKEKKPKEDNLPYEWEYQWYYVDSDGKYLLTGDHYTEKQVRRSPNWEKFKPSARIRKD